MLLKGAVSSLRMFIVQVICRAVVSSRQLAFLDSDHSEGSPLLSCNPLKFSLEAESKFFLCEKKIIGIPTECPKAAVHGKTGQIFGVFLKFLSKK